MIYDEFLVWCHNNWTEEYRLGKLSSKLSDEDIAILENLFINDMVALLTELQLEIEKLKEPYYCCHYKSGLNDCKEIIQQKISSLKENTDGNK